MNFKIITIGTCNLCSNFVPFAVTYSKYTGTCKTCVDKVTKISMEKGKLRSKTLGGVSAN
jgi:hypothetical protein